MSYILGIISALAAPLLLTLGFILWDNHWRGSAFALNMADCVIVSVSFLGVSIVARGRHDLFPSDLFTTKNVGFLILSSIVGLLIANLAWFQALQKMGARRVLFMESLKPFFAAGFGWLFLGEHLRLPALGGIVLTVCGVLIVNFETGRGIVGEDEKNQTFAATNEENAVKVNGHDEDESTNLEPRSPIVNLASSSHLTTATKTEGADIEAEIMEKPPVKSTINHNPTANFSRRSKNAILQGYAYALIMVIFDTFAYALTKNYGEGMSTWEVNFIRFGFAGAFMSLCSLILSLLNLLRRSVNVKVRSVLNNDDSQAEEDNQTTTEEPNQPSEEWYRLPLRTMTRHAWVRVILGMFLATFFMPALSYYALFQIPLALVFTLGSVGPLYALPLAYLFQRNQVGKLTVKAWIGAILTVAGVVVLSLWGTLQEDEEEGIL